MLFFVGAIPAEQVFFNEGRAFANALIGDWKMTKRERFAITQDIFPDRLQIMIDLLNNFIKFEKVGERNLYLKIDSSLLPEYKLSSELSDESITDIELAYKLRFYNAEANFKQGILRYLKPWLLSRRLLTNLKGCI